jgi:hypothetical protein
MGKTLEKFRRCNEIKEKNISLIIFDMGKTLEKFRTCDEIKEK